MTTPIDSAPIDEVTTALLQLLRGSGRDVWDGAYGGDPVTPTYPYGILYSIPGGSAEPMPDLDADTRTVTAVWQVTSVSRLRNQCEQAARVFRDRLLARSPTGGWLYPLTLPTGWECVDRRPDPAMPGTDHTGDPPTAIFTRPARYLLTLAPTS